MSDGEPVPADVVTLIHRLLDGEATEGDRAGLIDLLRSDPAVRQTYTEHVCFDALLREQFGTEGLLGLVDSVADEQSSERQPPEISDAPTRSRMTRRMLFFGMVVGLTSVAAVLVVGLTFLLLPATQSARQAARSVESQNNLRQIGIALHNHHEQTGTFPAAHSTDELGTPLLSWRVHLLPYLDHQDLYDRFHLNEPWNSPHNSTLIPLIPDVYQKPDRSLEEGQTCYQAIQLDEGVFPTPTRTEFGIVPPPGIDLQQVTDGPSNTIAVVEVDSDLGVVWSRPVNYQVDLVAPLSGLNENQSDGFLALFLDGVVRVVSSDIAPDDFLSSCTRDDSASEESVID